MKGWKGRVKVKTRESGGKKRGGHRLARELEYSQMARLEPKSRSPNIAGRASEPD